MNIISALIDYDTPAKSLLHELRDEYGHYILDRYILLRLIDKNREGAAEFLLEYRMDITVPTCDYDI